MSSLVARTPQELSEKATGPRLLAWVRSHTGRVALGVLAFGFILRVVLAALGWPATDSDEGTMGLMALHIALHGAHPVFFYGQAYMGALEAYLAAALFRVDGPSLFMLRLAVILLSTAALGTIYLLARRLYSPGLALATLVLFTLGSPEAIDREIFAGGGYAETLLFGALALLLAHSLARTARTCEGRSPQRLVIYAGLGIAIGLGIWSDVLVAPFVLGALVLVALFCRREVLGIAGLCLALGFLIGYAPVLAYTAQAPNHNPLAVAASIDQSSSAYTGNVAALFLGEAIGTVAVAVPTITGGSALLPLASKVAWPLTQVDAGKVAATLVHGLWGIGILALLIAALVGSWMALRRIGWGWRAKQGGDPGEAADTWARALLVVGAALTIALFASSPVAARAPATNSRYLIGVLIALPALLAPLWSAVWRARSRSLRWARAGLLVVLLAYLAGVVEVFQGVPYARAVYSQQEQLIGALEKHGVTAVYSEYWTCDRLAFLTQERVICASLDPRLQPDLDRYFPYRAQVAASAHPWYVFPLSTEQARTFAARVATTPGAYTTYVIAGYVLYQPNQ